MTDEGMERPDLDAIRKRIEREPLNGATVGMVREARRDRDALLAEVERLRAQPSHQQQPGWLPIESAPKDGTHVLLTDGEMISCGYWCGSQHAPRWMSDSGEPTHWQPLPEPPANA